MSVQIALGILAGIMALVSVAVLLIQLRPARRGPDMRALMGQTGTGTIAEIRQRLKNDESGEELEKIKLITKRSKSNKRRVNLEEMFFRAGIFSDRDKKEFARLRIIAPFVFGGGFCVLMYLLAGFEYGVYGLIAGVLSGLQLPNTVLSRRVKNRAEEIMYYLPLVIEQIAIGVSSSLDVGPCLQRVVQMADERDSHNVVTELVRHVQFYVKSGASLQEALNEVGLLSGSTELKHAFMSLAQVARHGGEITRQLQELADAVAGQRETRIEAKIKRLELEATGPVALVFAGFLIILLIGFGMQIQKAFG